MSENDPKPAAPNVIQHPAQATHMALPTEVMNELISMTAAKYTWAELDPLMSGKVKKMILPMRVDENGAVTVIKPPPE